MKNEKVLLLALVLFGLVGLSHSSCSRNNTNSTCSCSGDTVYCTGVDSVDTVIPSRADTLAILDSLENERVIY